MMPIVTEEASVSAMEAAGPYGNPYATTPVYAASARTTHLLRSTIVDQLSAIKERNYKHAMNLAAIEFRSCCPSHYVSALTGQFPDLISATDTQFTDAEINEHGTMAVEDLMVKSADTYTTFTYLLEKTNDGWRICNVQRGTWMPSIMEANCTWPPTYNANPSMQ